MQTQNFEFKTPTGKTIILSVNDAGFSVRDINGVYIVDATVLEEDGRIDFYKHSKQFSISSNEYRVCLIENRE